MRYLPIFMFCVLVLNTSAQNMVPNGDFEYYSSCPFTTGQVNYCNGWRQYHGGTSDYYNCTTIASGTPGNYSGYQPAASGTGYLAVINAAGTGSSAAYKEYVSRAITPLTVGNYYVVSMSVNYSNFAGRLLNDLGVWFYDNGPSSTISGVAVLPITPQISYANYGALSDTLNWVRLSAVMYADSAYDNIVIGGFSNTAPTASGHGYATWDNLSYYYIDSVVVKLANGIINHYADSMICAGDTFQVPYSLDIPAIYAPGNIFMAQLSNPAGDFTSGVTIIGTRAATTAGSITCVVPSTVTPGNNYRIRIISTNATDSSLPNQYTISIGVSRVSKPSASSNSPVCAGNKLYLYANCGTTGVSYSWTGPSSFNASIQNPFINNVTATNSGAYIVTARLNGCINKDTTLVSISSMTATSINAISNSPLCENDTLKLNAIVGSTANNYRWTGPGGYTSSVQNPFILNATTSLSGDYIVTADYMGCILKDTVNVIINPLPANLNISSNSPICSGNTIYIISGSGSSGVNYSWTGPGNFSTTQSAPAIYNAQTYHSGMYRLTATLGSCSAYDSIWIIIKQSAPKPVIITDTVICEGETLHITADSIISDANYYWSGPDNFTATVPEGLIFNITTKATGKYILTADKKGCIQTDSIDILVKGSPKNPVITSNSPLQTGQDLFLNLLNPSPGVQYIWTGPNGFTSYVINPVIFRPGTEYTGTYFITADSNGCIVSSTLPVQIEQHADTGNILLYPTPNDGLFYLRGIFKTDQYMPLRIFDAWGQLVYTATLQTQNKKLLKSIPLNGTLASGEYSLHIMIDGKKKILRFTVIR